MCQLTRNVCYRRANSLENQTSHRREFAAALLAGLLLTAPSLCLTAIAQTPQQQQRWEQPWLQGATLEQFQQVVPSSNAVVLVDERRVCVRYNVRIVNGKPIYTCAAWARGKEAIAAAIRQTPPMLVNNW